MNVDFFMGFCPTTSSNLVQSTFKKEREILSQRSGPIFNAELIFSMGTHLQEWPKSNLLNLLHYFVTQMYKF